MDSPKQQGPTKQQLPFVARLFIGVQRVTLVGLVAFVGIFVVSLFVVPRLNLVPSAQRAPCQSNLRQIGLALHEYYQAYGCFPPAYIADKDGKSMHSWRVLLLPFLDCDDLYKQYDFAEPWNGPHNSRLMGKCPSVYRCPLASNRNPSATNYLAVVGAATLWPGGKSPRLEDIRDGMSNTIGVVEVADSDINWMEPRDMGFDQAVVGVNKDRHVGISSNHSGGANVSFVDGSVRYLPESVSPATLRAFLTIAGGEKIEMGQDGTFSVRPPQQPRLPSPGRKSYN